MRRGNTIENEALDEVDLEHVLGEEGLDYRIAWGRSGRQIQLRHCPFCANNKYKVYVNADTGLGNCFAGSCTQGTFNKWQLLKAIYDLNSRDLKSKISQLAVEQGWRPKRSTVIFEPEKLDLPDNVRVADLHAMPRYLLERMIDPKLASYFDLRWCDHGVFTVVDPDAKIIKQDYSKRVIIPIYDMEGSLVSFQGRDATGESPKRYLFPPMYASTGSHLYNIQNWQEGMDTVVISEGPFDVIGTKRGLDYAKMTNVLPVGSFGMTFSINPNTDDQMNKLLALKKRGLRKVVFLWDNEPAAIRRALDAALAIMRYGFEVSVAKLDTSKDPGDASPEEVARAIKGAHVITSALTAMLVARKLIP